MGTSGQPRATNVHMIVHTDSAFNEPEDLLVLSQLLGYTWFFSCGDELVVCVLYLLLVFVMLPHTRNVLTFNPPVADAVSF